MIWLILLLIFLFLPEQVRAGSCTNYRFVVGQPTKIYGPGWLADVKLVTFKNGETLYGYFGMQETYRLEGNSVESLRMTDKVAIGRGTWGEFDGDGAWLMKVWKTGDGVIRATYHAEDCHEDISVPVGICPPGKIKHKAVAYAESRDGGKTFVKPNYPNNLIIYPDNVEWKDNGDGGMIQIGEYYYLYYLIDYYKIGVARAPTSGLGKPGTWTKYYQGSFSQPGVGGKATKVLDGYSPTIIFNQYLDKYIMVVMDAPHNIVFYLSDWDDSKPEEIGLKWEKFSKIIVPAAEGFWGQDPRKFLGFMAYPGLTGLNGEPETVERSFYLTYSYFPQGRAETKQSTKIVRKVDVYCNDKDDALVSFQEFKNNDNRDTMETVHYYQEAGYSMNEVFGYIDTEASSSLNKHDICYYDGWKNNFLKPASNSCSSPEIKIGTAGYFVREYKSGLVPIYQCFDSVSQKHYLATVNNPCPQQTWLVGYIYPTNYAFADITPTATTVPPTNTPKPTTPPPSPTSASTLAPNPTLTPCNNGDYNSNGVIDINDLISWYVVYRSNQYTRPADFNCDNKINISDLIVWYRGYRGS